MSNKGAFLLLLLVFALGGCTIWGSGPSNLVVTSAVDSFHPVAPTYQVKLTVEGVSGFSIDWGDEVVEDYSNITSPVVLTHYYHRPYMSDYHIVVTSKDGATKSVDIKVLNSTPENFGPWIGDVFDRGEKVMLNMTYYTHYGCPTANPQTVGAIDPDGDPLTFEWHIIRDGATIEESVFGPSGDLITGQETHSLVAYWFAGLYSYTTPIPLCGPVPQPPPAQTPSSTNTTIRVIVRDPAGAESVWEKRVEVHDTCTTSP